MRTTVTKEYLDKKIRDIEYIVMSDERTTICTLSLQNGFTVRGESSCVSVENFDTAVGRRIAYENAVDKVWPLEGYLLAEEIYRAKT